MKKELNEVIAYLEDLLNNKTSFDEAWDASYDLPHFISKRIFQIEEYSEEAAILLNDDVIDWCAALGHVKEDESEYCICEKTFRLRLSQALEKLKEYAAE